MNSEFESPVMIIIGLRYWQTGKYEQFSESQTLTMNVDSTCSKPSQLSSIAMDAATDSSKKRDVTANKDFVDRDWTFKQRETDDQILSKNREQKAGRGESKD